VIRGYFGDGHNWDVEVAYSEEPYPLGTAGGVKRIAWFFEGPFFVWYGDNLSSCNLKRLYAFHCRKRAVATIALFSRPDVTQSGIVGLDADDRVCRFLEKPRSQDVFSHWVNAGIFVLEREVLDLISPDGTPDFGRDVFPAMLTAGLPVYGYRMSEDEGLWWIDTPEDLARLDQLLAGERLRAVLHGGEVIPRLDDGECE
jgi:NDP-sugar pyrophosphorylase family protein